MTENHSHLSFLAGGRRHAIPMASVLEMVYVPMIQPTELVSGAVLGVFNLRGETVPVLDLPALLGLPSRPLVAEDVLLIFRPAPGAGPHGLVVEAVEDLVTLKEEDLRPPMADPATGRPSPLMASLGLQDERLYHILDLERLVAAALADPGPNRYDELFIGLGADLAVRLRGRAEGAVAASKVDGADRQPFLEMLLGGEGFGLPLASILRIAHCPPIFPVPGAPRAIQGLASQGGEPLLVVDLRPLLGMPEAPLLPEAYLLVVEDGAGALGLYADEVGTLFTAAPTDLGERPGKEASALVHGEWMDGEHVIHMLDLPLLLAHPGLSLSPTHR